MNRLTREARLISPDHARIVAAVLRSATSRVLAFADTLGGSTLITDMEQVVRIRSEVDLPVYQSGICTGREHGCGRPDANVRSGATTSASDARFVVPMRFDTTALLGKRPSKPDMPADGAAADFTRGHSGRSTQRPPYCPLSLTLQENDPPAAQSAVLGFVFVGTSASGAAAVGWRSGSILRPSAYVTGEARAGCDHPPYHDARSKQAHAAAARPSRNGILRCLSAAF